MNLYDIYLEAQRTENDMSSEIKQILEGGQLNFTYNDIRILNSKEYNSSKTAISFLIYGLNNKQRENFVMEVTKGMNRPTIFTYSSSIISAGFFPRLTMDTLTIDRLIDYGREQAEYFESPYTVEKIVGKVRPNEVDLSLKNRLLSHEIETLRNTEVEDLKMENSR